MLYGKSIRCVVDTAFCDDVYHSTHHRSHSICLPPYFSPKPFLLPTVLMAATPFPLLKGIKTWRTASYSAIDPSRPELSAKGKTIVVSGGGTGVGAAIVRAFAAAGASQIAIFGRRLNVLEATKAEIEEAYPSTHVSTFIADVTRASEVDAA